MEEKYFAHLSSIIDAGAIIGDGTNIWHFCHVMPTAIIGKNCILGQNCFIDSNVVIGNRVKIQNNVSVYSGVVLEDNVFVGPSVVFTNVMNPRSFIDRKSEFKKTLIKKGSSLGANATIICGISIGEFAIIGAGAVVTKDVLPYSVVKGNPAVHAGWISESGYKLHFNSDGRAYCQGNNEEYIIKDNIVTKI